MTRRSRRLQRDLEDRRPDRWRKCEVCFGHGSWAGQLCTACDGLGEVLEDRPDRLREGR